MTAEISLGVGPSPARRDALARRIRLLVAATITYNVIEAIVAITAGTIASSTALIGFGLDSVIEVSSAAAVAWQFSARDHAVREAREKTHAADHRRLLLRARRVRHRRRRPRAGRHRRGRTLHPRHRHRRPLAGDHAVPVRRPAQGRPRTRLRQRGRRLQADPAVHLPVRRAPGRPGRSTPPSAGPGPTRSPRSSSPRSRSRKAATPGRARAAARPPPQLYHPRTPRQTRAAVVPDATAASDHIFMPPGSARTGARPRGAPGRRPADSRRHGGVQVRQGVQDPCA